MANKEVQDQIKALRFRRALALATADDPVNIALKALAESWLEEARLTSAAQIKGGVSRAKELTAAAALLQLDLIELDHRLANRQPESPALVPAPATERIETDPTASARAAELVADSAAQGRGMIIAGEAPCLGDVGHAAHTWLGPRDEATGSSRWQCEGKSSPALLREVLALESSTLIREAFREVSGSAVFDRDPVPTFDLGPVDVEPIVSNPPPGAYLPPQIVDVNSQFPDTYVNREHAFIGRAIIEQAAAQLDVDLDPPIGTQLTVGGIPFTKISNNPFGGPSVDAVMQQLGIDLGEQAAHDTIDEEYAHVTAEPIATPSPFREASSTFAHNPTPRPTNVPAEATYSWGDLAAKPRVPGNIPAHVSPSQLSTMDKCPAQARMSRYDGLPGIPIWGGVGGTGFHTVVEYIERDIASNGWECIADYDAPGEIDKHWTKAFHLAIAEEIANGHGIPMDRWYASNAGKENYSWWLVEGAEMLRRYVHWRRKNNDGRKILVLPDGKPALELELHLDVEYLDVKVILDSAWIMPNGDLDLVDYKTGSRMDKDTIQLGTQAHALERALETLHLMYQVTEPASRPQVTAHYFDARKGTLTPQFDPIERHPLAELSMRYADLDDKRRNRPAVPKRSDMCIACPVRYLCPAYN